MRGRSLVTTVLRWLIPLAVVCAPADASPAPVIAAAADLQFALTDIAARFRQDTGQSVTLTFGSSGNFLRQIQQGAPYQLYLSADESLVMQLSAAGLTEDDGVRYAIGRIALFAAHASPLAVDAGLDGLREALAAGQIGRFAIANPEHAPYGKAAEQALKQQGLWEALASRLVLGENVAQAAQFATSGAVQGGIVAYSLVLSPSIARLGTFALLPASWHAPLHQRMVLLRNAGPVAREFYAYLGQPVARAVLAEYGFALPDDAD